MYHSSQHPTPPPSLLISLTILSYPPSPHLRHPPPIHHPLPPTSLISPLHPTLPHPTSPHLPSLLAASLHKPRTESSRRLHGLP